MPLIAEVANTWPLLPTAITTPDATITIMSSEKKNWTFYSRKQALDYIKDANFESLWNKVEIDNFNSLISLKIEWDFESMVQIFKILTF